MAEVNLGRIGFVNKGSWNSAANYKPNDVVKYGGSTYAAKRPNTGVIPPTNGVDSDDWFYFVNNSDYVDKTSDQDITGVKTFTNGITTTKIIGETTFIESPIVPTPTTDYQVATKKYVDDSNEINALPNKPTPVDADNLVLQEVGGLLKKLSFANLMNWVKSFSFGWGQTWQNVIASRAKGVTYTNNTGKPIIFSVSSVADPSSELYLVVDGVDVIVDRNSDTGSSGSSACAVVPNGSTYSIKMPNSEIGIWTELR